MVHLAVVRRGELAAFEFLSRTFADDPTVRVLWDRRIAGRRQAVTAVVRERRRSDRRRAPAVESGDEYHIVRNQEAPVSGESGDDASLRVSLRAIALDIECAVRSDLPVLISGGGDADRAHLARLIHQSGTRHRGPFVALTAAAVAAAPRAVAAAGSGATLAAYMPFDPMPLLLPDAVRVAEWLESARTGTLFISEVSELSAQLQDSLLLALRSLDIGPDGRPSVRVIAGTRRQLPEHVLSSLSAELFYVLNAIHLSVPPAGA